MIEPVGPRVQATCQEVKLGCRLPDDGFTRKAYKSPVDEARLDALIAAE